jgi:hypothetical protein
MKCVTDLDPIDDIWEICCDCKIFNNPILFPICTSKISNFFAIPFHLQSILVYSANCLKIRIQWHAEECSLALLSVTNRFKASCGFWE